MFLLTRYDFMLQQEKKKKTCIVDKIPAGSLSKVRNNTAFLVNIFTWKKKKCKRQERHLVPRRRLGLHTTLCSHFRWDSGHTCQSPDTCCGLLQPGHTCQSPDSPSHLLWAPLSSEKLHPRAQNWLFLAEDRKPAWVLSEYCFIWGLFDLPVS